jgi:hypothetical protein
MTDAAHDSVLERFSHLLFRGISLVLGTLCLALGLGVLGQAFGSTKGDFGVGCVIPLGGLFQLLSVFCAILARGSRHLDPGGRRWIMTAVWINGAGAAVWAVIAGWLIIGMQSLWIL